MNEWNERRNKWYSSLEWLLKRGDYNISCFIRELWSVRSRIYMSVFKRGIFPPFLKICSLFIKEILNSPLFNVYILWYKHMGCCETFLKLKNLSPGARVFVKLFSKFMTSHVLISQFQKRAYLSGILLWIGIKSFQY